MTFRALILAFLSLLPGLAAAPAAAQDTRLPSTILVLDASGSMWGQIDGVNKIVIARQVIGALLDDLPADLNLGLVAYGHNTRGDCGDIETLVAPATGNRARIEEIVNGLTPRGSTPLSAAVIQAAEALRATEEPATVVLVSDGRETCDMDPCEVGRVLEETGIDFTAHVVGFDVADPDERAQLQCLAENTGGTFLTASNAAELTEALEQVTQAPPVPGVVRVQAVLSPGGGAPERPLDWMILTADGTPVPGAYAGTAFEARLDPGAYRVQATRAEPDGPATYASAFAVTAGAEAAVTVTMPEIVAPQSVTLTATLGAGGPAIADPVIWTVTGADSTDIERMANPATADLMPGAYTANAYWTVGEVEAEARFVVADAPVEVTVAFDPPSPTFEVTLAARIGSEDGPAIADPVTWSLSPLADGAAAPDGNPAIVALDQGAYSVTATWAAEDLTRSADFVVVNAAREIALIFPEPLAQASVIAPTTAVAGSTIEVGWTGPGAGGDYLSVRAPGADRSVNYTYIRDGNPAGLLMPIEPGTYEVAYVAAEGDTILASRTIEVAPVAAGLIVPDSAIAGDTLEVGWTGPDYAGDYLSVRTPGADRSVNYTYTRDGNPAALLMPAAPGTYEVAYIASQGDTILASRTIEVAPVAAALSPPDTAIAGETVEVGWRGPDYGGDYISVREPGADRSVTYTYTRDGNPASVTMPSVPGSYDLSYVMAQEDTVLATVQIQVTDVAAALTLPDTAIAGETVEVGWRGPDYGNDAIVVRPTGGGNWINYTRTRQGNPLGLTMPAEPGTYEVAYVMDQDNTTIASRVIEVTPVTAALDLPDTAIAGETVEVGWRGPDYGNDAIVVRPTGGGNWINYTRTRQGNPLGLTMPAEPGTYEVAYVMDQDNTTIASRVIEVTPVTAALDLPDTAIAGETVEVGWRGPDYGNDAVVVRPTGGGNWINYTRTRQGNPLGLTMPAEPGTYEVAYVMDQDNTTIASRVIEVTPVTAALDLPDTAIAGETVEVGWRGPDYGNDAIVVRPTGGGNWINYTRTRQGNPLGLTMPAEPGTYEVAYVMDQDNTTIASRVIEVTAEE